MSDPVTNMEIEDVLSSIRRLVSDGDKPRSGGRQAAASVVDPVEDPPASADARSSEEAISHDSRPHPAGGDPVPDRDVAATVSRFVLTPALRVDETETAPQSETQSEGNIGDGVEEALIEEPLAEPAKSSDSADVRLPEESGSPAEVAGTSPASDDGPLVLMPEASVSGPRISRKSGEKLYAVRDAAMRDAAEAPQGTPADRSSESVKPSLEETIAELEAAITHQTDDWEPDGSEETPIVDWASAAAQAGLFASRHRRPTLVEDAEELPPRGDDSRADEPTDPPIAAAEEATHARASDTEEEPTTFDAESAAAAIFGDDTVIDEAALRDLVAEIVRQELQGKLGERITRNVRKLVRREIYRVISSESFD